MSRIRTIKPEFWTDSKTGTLSDRAVRIFLGMWNHSDDYGVIEYDIPALKAMILPYVVEQPIEAVGHPIVSELLPKGLLQYFGYSSTGEPPFKPYLFITNFPKHQKIDRPGKPIIPGWKKGDTPDTFDDGSTNIQRTFDEPSPPEGKGREVVREKDNTKPLSGKPDITPVEKPSENSIPYEDIIGYLNRMAGKAFNPKTESSRKHIRARWKEGARQPEFVKAIENQVRVWKGTENEIYLRPQTLFNSEKFDGYVNNTAIKPVQKIRLCDFDGCSQPGKHNHFGSHYCSLHVPR